MVSLTTLIASLALLFRSTTAMVSPHDAVLKHIGTITDYIQQHGKDADEDHMALMMKGFEPLLAKFEKNVESIDDLSDEMASQYNEAFEMLVHASKGL